MAAEAPLFEGAIAATIARPMAAEAPLLENAIAATLVRPTLAQTPLLEDAVVAAAWPEDSLSDGDDTIAEVYRLEREQDLAIRRQFNRVLNSIASAAQAQRVDREAELETQARFHQVLRQIGPQAAAMEADRINLLAEALFEETLGEMLLQQTTTSHKNQKSIKKLERHLEHLKSLSSIKRGAKRARARAASAKRQYELYLPLLEKRENAL